MADRFANGDTGNDLGGLEGDRLTTGFDPTDKGFYHGGDLAGIIDRLDYIESLGTTAIWLTPSFKNRPVQGAGTDASAGYHGYWITDFTQIDPHLGTNEEMEQLVDLAHDRGMKVFFDIITNHTADVIDYEEGQYSYVDKATEPYRDAEGVEFDDRDYAGTDTFPALDEEVSFPYTPVFRSEADATVKVPQWLNDRTLYHNRGDSTFTGENSEYGDFIGLDDLFTEHPDVVDGMGEIYSTWAEFGIDGFRIDTVKHVNMEFWQDFSPRVLEAARESGNDDFFMFGEVYDANPEFMSRYTTEGTLQATIDFGFQSRAVDFAAGGPTTGMRELFAGDDWYTDADSNAYQLPTFLGNHDMGRVGKFLADRGATGEELLERDVLAHELMYLTRGQPVVYYGDEQGLVGDGGDKDARETLFTSQVASYNDNPVIGGPSGARERYDTNHPLYRAISSLAQLREDHPALADGTQVHRYASAEAGIFAVSRISRDRRPVEYLVVANNSTEAASAEVATYLPDGRFRPIHGGGAALVADAEGRVDVALPPLSVRVFRSTSTLKATGRAPEVFATQPAGGVVGGRAEIGASVPANEWAEVSFAVRPVGTQEWTYLGTDDNAPYRVFHDVRDTDAFPTGTLLEYRTVLEDLAGKRSADSTWAVVGDPAPPAGGGGAGPGDDGGVVDPVEQPEAVAVAGSHNSEMGCPASGGNEGDWQPWCDQAQLTYDENSQVWTGTYELPAGDYEYKAALNRTWDVNYGAGGALNGQNIAYTTDGSPVEFIYEHARHYATSTAEGPVVTLAGSFQSELGCSSDWAPDCLRSRLIDTDGDGTYSFGTTQLPAGRYEVKVAHGRSWDENYGVGGAPGGGNYAFDAVAGEVTWFSYDVATHVLTITVGDQAQAGDLGQAKAHWVAPDLLAWPASALPPGGEPQALRWRLHQAPEGGLGLDAEAVTGGSSVPLAVDPAGLPASVTERFPHLSGYVALRLDRRAASSAGEWLTGQLAVAQHDPAGPLLDASGVQVPGVLDALYPGAANRALGVTWKKAVPTYAIWAPTAKDVDLLVWQHGSTEPRRVQTARDRHGVWSVQGQALWKNAQYLYEVTVYAPTTGEVEVNRVTDPYSVALTLNSTRSVAVDLADPNLAPQQWRTTPSPTLERAVDSSIYELHVRDFSIGDESVPEAHRGTYLAFADEGAGRQHLRTLADAGLNTVHLLPTFDITSIEEDRSAQAEPACDLPSLPPDSTLQQECIAAVAARDGFNWGYDPYHWMAPEGSYATAPHGGSRVIEFRTMVGALHADGLRVVLDKVFNHTSSSGQAQTSVLDRVVPGYYHRLNAETGAVETSTCCQNIATEHTMAGKAMVDGTVLWAKHYKVDGFRYDLMGHHSKQNMLDVRAALDRLTLAKDGVDGTSIYLYGEGWNFGEVASNARFEQATQGQLGGTGIGTFSDRLRDAVRGGGPFDENPRTQGFGTGLFGDPNGDAGANPPDTEAARQANATDLVQLGLVGNLRAYEFTSAAGDPVRGDEVGYNGSPAGYADEPVEVVTYVDAHDNETLWDTLTYKLPQSTPMDQRIRMNTLSLATTTLSQTPSFWHAGADLLRSKSLDRNSYDSGDWFNTLDWTGEDNGFGRGLPPAPDNEAKWAYQRPLLADPSLKPTAAQVQQASAQAQDLLRLRTETPLLRLGEADLIQQKVSFPLSGTAGAQPGVVVMRVDDTVGADVDPRLRGALVVFNTLPGTVQQQVPGLSGSSLSLSPVQAGGSDPVVKQTTWTSATGTVTVPGRTVAVLLQP
jgi:pullulanase-type alpha-1,6-glucosidase